MIFQVSRKEFTCQTNKQMVFCHASSLATFSEDETLVVWFGGSDREELSPRGRTWCTAYPTALPNNNSAIALTKIGANRLALVYNPIEQDLEAGAHRLLGTSVGRS